MAADCCGWAKFVHRVSHTRSIWLNMKCHPETDRLHSRARRMTTTMNSSQLCPLWLCCHNNHEQCADRENYTPNLYKHSAPITQTTSYTHTIYRSSIQPAGAIYNLVLICKDDLTTTTTTKTHIIWETNYTQTKKCQTLTHTLHVCDVAIENLSVEA